MESQEYGRQEDKVEEADHSHFLEVTKKYSLCPNKRSSAPAVRGEQDLCCHQPRKPGTSCGISGIPQAIVGAHPQPVPGLSSEVLIISTTLHHRAFVSIVTTRLWSASSYLAHATLQPS